MNELSALERNMNIIKDIVSYCDEIKEAREIFGDSFEALAGNKHYQNSISMCVLQIGELSSRLTENFKERYDGVPWRKIKDMRNLVAHNYRIMNLELLWEAISIHVVYLCEYCEKIIDIEEGSKND